MARTPLLLALRRLARDHQIASQRRVDVERVQDEQREAARVGRRRFLAGTAATAVAAGLSRPTRAWAGPQPRIAVIGAGISGLSAALTLADAGVGCTVYESSGRIGGRMFSNTGYWNDGQVSEWGGELIDTGHKTIQTLAKRFNLPLVDLIQAMPSSAEDTYSFGGKYYSVAQANTDFKPVHNALQGDVQAASYPTLYNAFTAAGQALDNMSVHDWIDARVPGGHGSPMGQLLDAAYAIEYGADTTDQSALNLVYLLGYKANPGQFSIFGASDERYHIVGGNQQLPVAIANQLGVGRTVALGYRMLAIAANPDGTYALTFSTSGGTKVVTADIVILGLPFAVLRNLNYANAGFDALKNIAIQELGRGRNGKLQLQFGRRLWSQTGPWPGVSTGTTYADTGYQNTWEVSRGQAGASGILVDYTGGTTTLAMSTPVAWGTIGGPPGLAKDAQRFLGQIEPVLPGLTATWNGKATSSLPHLDANFQCSYSYWRVGQYTSFSGYEKVRQGNVFFCGEHTSQDFQGFMEGGASEGIRAANQVLTALGKR
jgi:monoamine oxidase